MAPTQVCSPANVPGAIKRKKVGCHGFIMCCLGMKEAPSDTEATAHTASTKELTYIIEKVAHLS